MYNRIPQEFKENEPFCLWHIENEKNSISDHRTACGFIEPGHLRSRYI